MTQSTLTIRSGQHTDKGVKAENQDFHGLVVPKGHHLQTKGIAIAIADGVSACEHGREAAEASVNGLLSDYYSTPDSWTVKTCISKVLSSINRWMSSHANPRQHQHVSHASTLSGLILKSNTAHMFHVGDSRIYLIRGDDIDQLTVDHRRYVSDKQSYLKRAIGIDLMLEIDYKKIELKLDDIFVLTTDGVHDFLSDQDINNIVLNNVTDLPGAARVMVEQALSKGSNDNLSCQIIKIDALPDPDATEFFEQLTQLPFPPDLEAGQKLDHYKIIRQIHASSRSQCYYAVNELDDTPLVLKTPSVNFSDDPFYIKAFLQEEWIGRQINSPHVLKVYEHPQERKFLYQIAEYIEGKTLRAWMNENPEADLQEIVTILEEIGKGLRAFHRLEMVHRDLKPENIMLDKHKTVRIIDFGSTRISGDEEILNPLDDNHLVGTISYTAPEFATGSAGTPLSDQFSLAVIAYEMLAGELPFKSTLQQKKIDKRKYISIRQFTQRVPVWMEGAIKKALNDDPDNRYFDIDEFIYDLRHPNPNFVEDKNLPLIERDPLKFWKALALIMAIINLVLLFKL